MGYKAISLGDISISQHLTWDMIDCLGLFIIGTWISMQKKDEKGDP